MAYVVNKTDGTVLARLSDGVVNTTATDLTLIGRNFAGFGEYLNENLVKLLENFASTAQPVKPLGGQLWFDKTTNTIKVYTGTSFKPVANITVDTAEPEDLATGDFWFDEANEQLYVFNGTTFKLIGPALSAGTAASGFQVAVIEDDLGLNHTVVRMLVDGTVVGVISKDEFTPATVIPGFGDGIFKGYTLNQALFNNQFYGQAQSATYLYDGTSTPTDLTPSYFMRTDIDTSTTGDLTVGGNISLGSNSLTLSVDTLDNALIRNIQVGKKLSLGINRLGTLSNGITIDGDTGYLGIWNDTPAEEVDIVGNVAVDGSVQADSMVVTGALDAGLDNSTVASTAFVQANKVSPAFTGTPTAPTATTGTSTTQIATTAFVANTVAGYLALDGGDMTGAILLDRAAALTPAIAFTEDPDTGIWSQGANTINIATGGVSRFKFDNTGTLTVTGTVIELSDSSVKEDITPIKNALGKVLQLTGVTYRSKITGQRSIGLLADQVEQVEPTLVGSVNDGLLGVNYSKTTALLIEALKEQQAQIEDLKRQLDAAIQNR